MKVLFKEGCVSYRRIEYINRKKRRKDFTTDAMYNSRSVF
ncbi:hypothetical protein SAMN02745751_01917 [Dethiosulfatibacter aminovorans DSM 17477]|uniref:Uncharacterized protein n=1 Tax=Dethiosulfatibacter aminovorans DSM 17477 TaxID=1121476 RepID=A0A1M6H4U2_9FIRM|nr:hypothetical protein SAMN02745751_01917 [Dethiosulfatibacter aminovorans DSM 17477]